MADRPMLFPDGNVYNIPSDNVERARQEAGAIPDPSGDPLVLFGDGSLYKIPRANVSRALSENQARMVTGRERFSLELPGVGLVNDIPVKNLRDAVSQGGADLTPLLNYGTSLSTDTQPQLASDPELSNWIGRPLSKESILGMDQGDEYFKIQEKQREGRSGFFENLFDFTAKDLPFFIGRS